MVAYARGRKKCIYTVQNLLLHCKHLHQVYTPPLLWGKSGHIQTAVYGKIGRWNCPSPSGNRRVLKLDSGETMSYDIYQPADFNDSVGKLLTGLIEVPIIKRS